VKIEPDKDKDNDCGPKPADVPGYHWNCEPNKDGRWRWVRVKAVKEKDKDKDKNEMAKSIIAMTKTFKLDTEDGRKLWVITIVAALAADLKYRGGRTLIAVLTTVLGRESEWLIQLVVGTVTRVVNVFS